MLTSTIQLLACTASLSCCLPQPQATMQQHSPATAAAPLCGSTTELMLPGAAVQMPRPPPPLPLLLCCSPTFLLHLLLPLLLSTACRTTTGTRGVQLPPTPAADSFALLFCSGLCVGLPVWQTGLLDLIEGWLVALQLLRPAGRQTGRDTQGTQMAQQAISTYILRPTVSLNDPAACVASGNTLTAGA